MTFGKAQGRAIKDIQPTTSLAPGTRTLTVSRKGIAGRRHDIETRNAIIDLPDQ